MCSEQVRGAGLGMGPSRYHLLCWAPEGMQHQDWGLRPWPHGSDVRRPNWISCPRSGSCCLVPKPHGFHSPPSDKVTYVWPVALLLSRESLEEANKQKNMLLEHLGSLVAFKAKNILMNYQQSINMDGSSRPQRHRDANLRKGLAECVLGTPPSPPQAAENPRWEDPDGGGRRDGGSQESQPDRVSKNRIVCSQLCLPSHSANQTIRGPLHKSEGRPLKRRSSPFSRSDVMRASPTC